MINRQIDISDLSSYRVDELLRDRFSWASDHLIEEAVTDAAIMINSLMMAIEHGADNEAIMVMSSIYLERHEHLADAREHGIKSEREICKTICCELADRGLHDPCCLAALLRAKGAIDSRNHPS